MTDQASKRAAEEEHYRNAMRSLDNIIFWAKVAKIRLGECDMPAVHDSVRNARQCLRLGFRYSHKYILGSIFTIKDLQ
ncbi:MAG: hypothetical protein LUC93_03255 [Planctomycetaceae bacterium]|nr:hypothetical protein [Planctomycetaceae bacterium]